MCLPKLSRLNLASDSSTSDDFCPYPRPLIPPAAGYKAGKETRKWCREMSNVVTSRFDDFDVDIKHLNVSHHK